MVSQLEKIEYLRRAGYRCEYCRRQINDDSYEIDHILPRSKSGKDASENFAIACKRCNLNKGDNVNWVDPITGDSHCLFHPRRMEWDLHFCSIDKKVRGKTPIGRATCTLLLRHTSQYRPRDLEWQPLEIFQDNREIYQYLNDLRFYRETNQFSLLEKLLSPKKFTFANLSPNENFQAEFVKNFLLMEIFLTRSSKSDLMKGLYIGDSLLKTYESDNNKFLSILHIQAILLKQSASLNFISGNSKYAIAQQKKAFQLHQREQATKGQQLKKSKVDKFTEIELRAIRYKYEEIEISPIIIRDLKKRTLDNDEYNMIISQKRLIDIILAQYIVPCSLGLEIFDRCSEILEVSGYGEHSNNIALQVSLRRRWWILNLLYSDSIDYDLLVSDLIFWKKTGMFNELREFIYCLTKIRTKLSDKIIKKIFYEILKSQSLLNDKCLSNIEQNII
jgi:hypothetical protein